jgi:hypothetical protein
MERASEGARAVRGVASDVPYPRGWSGRAPRARRTRRCCRVADRGSPSAADCSAAPARQQRERHGYPGCVGAAGVRARLADRPRHDPRGVRRRRDPGRAGPAWPAVSRRVRRRPATADRAGRARPPRPARPVRALGRRRDAVRHRRAARGVHLPPRRDHPGPGERCPGRRPPGSAGLGAAGVVAGACRAAPATGQGAHRRLAATRSGHLSPLGRPGRPALVHHDAHRLPAGARRPPSARGAARADGHGHGGGRAGTSYSMAWAGPYCSV